MRIARLLDTQVCFIAGTKVQTPDGPVNIEDLEAGDLVLARDERDINLAGPIMITSVVRPIVTHPRHLWHISFRSASGETEKLITTASHPLFVAEKAQFVAAGALELGQTLVLCSGGNVKVAEIRLQHAPDGESFTTYNIEVAGAHTYFVGAAGVWVHNSGRTLCEVIDVLYERYRKEGYTEEQAKAGIWLLLNKRIESRRLTRQDAAKHWKDASRALAAKGKFHFSGTDSSRCSEYWAD